MLGQSVGVANIILVVPVLLTNWGVESYAKWIILMAIPMYLSISDLGIGASVGNEVSKRKADVNGLVIKSSALLLSFILPIAIIVFFIVDEYLSNSVNAFLVILLSIFYILTNFATSVFRGLDLYAFALYRVNASKLLDLLILVLLSFFFSDFTVVLSVLILSKALLFIVLIYEYRKLALSSNWIPWRRSLSNVSLKPLAKPALGFMIMPLAYGLNNQGVIWVVAYVFSPSVVVLFNTLRSVTRVIYQSSGVISQSFWPKLSKLYYEGDFDSYIKLFFVNVRYSLALVLTTSLLLYILSPFVFPIIFSGEVDVDNDVFILFLCVNFLASMWQPLQMVLVSTNNHLQFSLTFLIGQVILLICLLAFDFEIIEFMLTLFVHELFNLFLSLFLSFRLINAKRK